MSAPAADNATDMLLDEVIALRARLDELEAATKGKAEKDDLDARILSFMRAHPIYTTALVVSKNIGAVNNVVGHRLVKLAKDGLVISEKEEGQTRMWRAVLPQA